jgi:hypothetical protein
MEARRSLASRWWLQPRDTDEMGDGKARWDPEGCKAEGLEDIGSLGFWCLEQWEKSSPQAFQHLKPRFCFHLSAWPCFLAEQKEKQILCGWKNRANWPT